MNPVDVEYWPKRKTHVDDLEIVLPRDSDVSEARIVAVGDLRLPEPVRAASVEDSDGRKLCIFEGWDVIRYLTPPETELTLRGTQSDGAFFSAKVNVTFVVKTSQ